MIAQTDYGSTGSVNNNNYSNSINYSSISQYHSGSATTNSSLGGSLNNVTTNSSMNPYAGGVIGSSNGYSNVLSISSGGITSVASCYPISSTHHLQSPDKSYGKDR